MVNDFIFSHLQITDITVELPVSSKKSIQSMDIEIDAEHVSGQVRGQALTGAFRTLTVTLDPPRVVAVSLQLTVHLRYRNILGKKWRSDGPFVIKFQELLYASSQGIGDRKEWHGKFRKLKVMVGLMTHTTHSTNQTLTISSLSLRNDPPDHEDRLTPTTERILLGCPHFRILVMGKTGVGKSSLINRTFGVDDAIVEHDGIGFADINKEIYSRENPHFVLHDSKGFEQGDDTNVKIVSNFINERKKMHQIKDKLHAVWVCINIPIAGGRLLETGIEKFLKCKIEDKLGNVPVIAVFTKYDLLVARENRLLKRADYPGKSKADIANLIEQSAQTKLHDICVGPFEEFVNGKVPHITVSTESGYEDRLSELIQVTYDHVNHYLADASVVSAMAQRTNHRVKIQASIEVGRRKYWERLATSVNFPGKTLRQCIDVIHADIIAVWCFDDPQGYLSSDQFKAMVSNVVITRGHLSSNPGKNLVAGVSLVAGIAGILSVLAGPVAPIVIPVAAALVTARWVYVLYQETTFVLRHLMTYIIDLTLILQNIFWLQELGDPDRPLSRRIIKMGVHAYEGSTTKRTLSFQIDKHLDGLSFHVGPDTTLNTIEALIKTNIIESTEMLEHRGIFSFPQIVGDDEPWEA
ncbi:hypothetical protein E4T56_gene18797 [Termitomyces sp. T112]|nr:hypothetical protein E4T56_gene18797 [Termitomyces sp. T112]KAH0583394.1 hypothetical protein H2248_009021 [Termitomyces sp. 'cryptogamus']